MSIAGQEEKFGSLRNKYSRKVQNLDSVGRITTYVRSLFEYENQQSA